MTPTSNTHLSQNENLNSVDVDVMLSYVGDFGKYQKLLLVLFSIINVLSSFHYIGQTFISVIPEHECAIPNVPKYENATAFRCHLSIQNDNSTVFKECAKWNYHNSYGFVSIVEELNWVCKDDWKPVLGQSVFFVGSVLGSLIFGIVADRIGRLHAVVIANIMASIGNIATIFSTNVTSFGINRFIAGCATDTNFVMMYIIVMEYIRPSMRTFGLNLTIGVFYCLGSMAVPWVAVLMKSWQYFLLIYAIPHAFVLGFYWIVPESAQWLISKGRLDEAIACFEKIAKFNGKKPISNIAIQGLKNYAEVHIKQEKKHKSFLGLLKTPKLRKKTLILIFKSMAMSLGYDAIARNVNGFHLSPFWVFTATSAAIFPGCLIILGMQDRVGRKAMASASLLVSGVFMATVGIILAAWKNASTMVIIILVIVARLGIIVAYNSGAQYAVELIPTEVRGQGVSVVHVAGHAATFFSPQVLYLSNFWRPLPEVTLGALLTVAAFACLFLPETLNRTLPVTLEDGEKFGEKESVFEFAFMKKPKTLSTLILTKDN